MAVVRHSVSGISINTNGLNHELYELHSERLTLTTKIYKDRKTKNVVPLTQYISIMRIL
jgi:hypothetical protein